MGEEKGKEGEGMEEGKEMRRKGEEQKRRRRGKGKEAPSCLTLLLPPALLHPHRCHEGFDIHFLLIAKFLIHQQQK